MGYDIECPYCGHGQEIDHDDGYGYEQDEIHQQECGYCEKVFAYTTVILFYYEAEKADCLNGGEHKFRKIHGCPEEYFKNRYRCEDCGEEVEKKDGEGDA